MVVSGKNIVFISPSFFGYERAIEKRLKELGGNVYFFDDRPSNGFWGKGLLRAHKKMYAAHIKRYYKPIERIIESIDKIDIVFLLSPEALPLALLTKIIKNHPYVKVLLYMWDSIQNKIGTKKYLPYCNKIFTFDPNDKQYDDRIEFCSLFYLNEYASIPSCEKYDYDLSFIGTAHSDRFLLANNIRQQIEQRGGRVYNFFYLQSKKLFLYRKITDYNFRSTSVTDFQYRALTSEETRKIICKSKAVLDIQHPKQTGLTMRTLEVLGSKRKLITTNSEIAKYDFYNSQNILIINRTNPFIPADFLETPYIPIPSSIYMKYSLDGWLETIFDDME